MCLETLLQGKVRMDKTLEHQPWWPMRCSWLNPLPLSTVTSVRGRRSGLPAFRLSCTHGRHAVTSPQDVGQFLVREFLALQSTPSSPPSGVEERVVLVYPHYGSKLSWTRWENIPDQPLSGSAHPGGFGFDSPRGPCGTKRSALVEGLHWALLRASKT